MIPTRTRRLFGVVAAAGMVGMVAPPSAQAEPVLGGFAANATAIPVKIEIYEPTIPIPAQPEAELNLAYTATEAASGPTANGRASWIWPGDPVGEGFKAFGEALHLPEELYRDGYPVQANSRTPGGPGAEADEPVPGAVMRTSTDAEQAVAKVGYSPDGEVDDDSGGPSAPPPAPSLGGGGAPAQAEDEPGLDTLVDADKMSSISRSEYGDATIKSYASSRLTDVSLLGGLITADSVKSTSRTTSTLGKGTTKAETRYAGLALAGAAFTVGRDGVEADGNKVPIPGLPSDPARALEALGISIVAPKPAKQVNGAKAALALTGLRVVIDTRVLHSKLAPLPLDDVVNQLPDELGQLKSLAGALVNLAPKIVLTLGNATSLSDAVPPIAFPPVAGGDPGPGTGTGTGTAGALPGTSAGGPPSGAAAPDSAPVADAPPEVAAAENASLGLPPLGSVPGMLMMLGFALASGVGWWLQRIGGFALGGVGACAHGLETGLPDLRRA